MLPAGGAARGAGIGMAGEIDIGSVGCAEAGYA